MKKFTLYKKAREKWGFEAQKIKLVEEMGELIQACCKYKRGSDDVKLLTEIVDVEIMLEQLKYNLCINKRIEMLKSLKLTYLESLIDEQNPLQKFLDNE